MTRTILLSSLTEEQKDALIQVQVGFIKELRGLLESIGETNAYVRRRYEKLLEDRRLSMPLLERVYQRDFEARQVEFKARANDRRWSALGGRA